MIKRAFFVRDQSHERGQCDWLNDDGLYCTKQQYYRHYCKEHALRVYDWVATRKYMMVAIKNNSTVKVVTEKFDEMYKAFLKSKPDAVREREAYVAKIKRYTPKTKPNYRRDRGQVSSKRK